MRKLTGAVFQSLENVPVKERVAPHAEPAVAASASTVARRVRRTSTSGRLRRVVVAGGLLALNSGDICVAFCRDGLGTGL